MEPQFLKLTFLTINAFSAILKTAFLSTAVQSTQWQMGKEILQITERSFKKIA